MPKIVRIRPRHDRGERPLLYESHFGLSPRPFGDATRPDAYVATPSRDAALRRLRYGLEHGGGPALLFGPSGSGKTILARTLARDLGAAATHLVYPALPASELLAYLADELNAPPGDPGPAGSLRRVRRAWRDAAQRGKRPLLVVDEAHLIDDQATFESLRLLLNFDADGSPELMLLIVGGGEVLLHLPPSLADRLTARALLGPLELEETSAYVLGRLALAGATHPLFDSKALRDLHLAADGIPRRLNRLADLSLLIAYAEGLDVADPRTVEVASREAAFEPLGV
jgi:type II secretory pathway predicted ATPase ExeA